MKCFLHFIVDQAGTKSDSWQLGKVRLTGTQTVKEDPVAKECLAQSCNWYQGLEGQNIWNSGSQLGQICTPMSRTFLVVTLGGGGATSKQWVETRDAAKILQHRKTLHNKEVSSPNCKSAEAKTASSFQPGLLVLVCILSSLPLLHYQHSNWDLRNKYCNISMCFGKKHKVEGPDANPDSAISNLCILGECLTLLMTQFSHLQI